MTATIRKNNERKGIEISFHRVPVQAARDELKAAGFKWNRKTKVWYIRNTKKNMAAALDFIAAYNAGRFTGPLFEKKAPEEKPEENGIDIALALGII